MIEVKWHVSLMATGGSFMVPDGTPDADISRKVDEQVQRSIYSTWSPYPAADEKTAG